MENKYLEKIASSFIVEVPYTRDNLILNKKEYSDMVNDTTTNFMEAKKLPVLGHTILGAGAGYALSHAFKSPQNAILASIAGGLLMGGGKLANIARDAKYDALDKHYKDTPYGE